MSKKIKCKYCGKEYSIKGIGAHIWRVHGKGKKFIPNPNPNFGGWNKGLTKENNKSLKKMSNTLKEGYESGRIKNVWKNRTHDKSAREKIRKSINERYANGWEVKCGRAKKYTYESPIAGKVKVDGTWELSVCKYLDNMKLQWKRNKTRFKYINLKNKESTYCPDFWVEDWKSYIEVKGYKTELDECKWKQFPAKLLIWDKKVLKEKNII